MSWVCMSSSLLERVATAQDRPHTHKGGQTTRSPPGQRKLQPPLSTSTVPTAAGGGRRERRRRARKRARERGRRRKKKKSIAAIGIAHLCRFFRHLPLSPSPLPPPPPSATIKSMMEEVRLRPTRTSKPAFHMVRPGQSRARPRRKGRR